LTPVEVDRLIAAAGDNRHGHRDATMVLLAYRHGLRAAELVALHWGLTRFLLRSTTVMPFTSIAPEILEPCRRQLRVTNGVLDILVAEVGCGRLQPQPPACQPR
jgi:integrase